MWTLTVGDTPRFSWQAARTASRTRWASCGRLPTLMWAEIRQEALDKDAACFERLFREIDAWLTEEDRQAGCFWILGI